jgi:hypothetical protein
LRYALVAKVDEERYVKGVVLVPETVDSQGDIYGAEEVRAAAHYFMEYSEALGKEHLLGLGKSKIRILENYLLDASCSIGNREIPEGTWILAARVLDDNLWQDIKRGAFTGWSIEGSALSSLL